jgi:hypothetical protein
MWPSKCAIFAHNREKLYNSYSASFPGKTGKLRSPVGVQRYLVKRLSLFSSYCAAIGVSTLSVFRGNQQETARQAM